MHESDKQGPIMQGVEMHKQKSIDAPVARNRRSVVFFLQRYARKIWAGRILSSLTRKIVVLNLIALFVWLVGLLILNEFRTGLIDARVESLKTQGRIIAGTIAASATSRSDGVFIDPEQLLQLQASENFSPADPTEFPINPERVAPILQRLISLMENRARIFGPHGELLFDTRMLTGPARVLRRDLPPPGQNRRGPLSEIWTDLVLFLWRGDFVTEHESDDGRSYPQIVRALEGEDSDWASFGADGELIVSVAVPIQRLRVVHGALLLSTQDGSIDAIIYAERMAIIRMFIVASSISFILSLLLAGTIAGPIKRLAAAAERVRFSARAREDLPEMSERRDEIGHLSRNLRAMTDTLYDRLEANEQFAADVAHELKNPLSSLRSAIETLPQAKNQKARTILLDVINHDIQRLDRLISDISGASRLDAELIKADAAPVDMMALLRAVASVANSNREIKNTVKLTYAPCDDPGAYRVMGHAGSLGQIMENLIDNARSFSPDNGSIDIHMDKKGDQIHIIVDDHGQGFREGAQERVFERFHTDRPEGEKFGDHSGLGLSISRAIAKAHQGSLIAQNRYANGQEEELDSADEPLRKTEKIIGARLILSLPVLAAEK